MAGGIASLASIALAPLAVLPAAVISVKSVKQGKQISDEIEKMELSVAEMDNHRAELFVVLNRTEEMSQALKEEEMAVKTILSTASSNEIEDIYRLALAAKGLAQLMDLDVFPDLVEPDSGEGTND